MTPTYLHVNTPADVDQACAGKWDGVVISITSSSNPKNHDWTPFTAALTAAAKHGLRCHLRLSPHGADAHNSDGSPSWWAMSFNDGEAWPTPYRPPLAVAKAYAEIYLRKAIGIAQQIYKAYASIDFLSGEIGNEAGLGGANCACLGRWSALRDIYYKQFQPAWARYQKSHMQADYASAKYIFLKVFPLGLWLGNKPIEEGTVEPFYWTMLRAELELIMDLSLLIFPYTFEGAKGTVGQREIDSCAGVDAQWIADHFNGRWGFNAYMNTLCTTAIHCGAEQLNRLAYQVGRMRKNPRISGALFNTEFGMAQKIKDTDMDLTSGLFDIAEGRQHVLNATLGDGSLYGAGFYRARVDDDLSKGFAIANADGTPVGKFLVCPGHV